MRDPGAESLLRIMDGLAPLRVEAHWREDIALALESAAELPGPVVLVGGTEAGRMLDRLREARAAVLVGAPISLSPNRVDLVHHDPGLAGRLAQAGIPFAFMTAGEPGYGPADLPFLAQLAVGQGLPEAAALAALTRDAARILGVEADLGSLLPGRRALIQVLSGPPLDPKTRVEAFVLEGEVVTL